MQSIGIHYPSHAQELLISLRKDSNLDLNFALPVFLAFA